jgi:hypothetical protein
MYFCLVQQFPYYTNDNRGYYTKQDHGGDGEIKAEVFFFYTDIARQSADPVQFVVKEIDDQSYQHYADANDHDDFARILAHNNLLMRQRYDLLKKAGKFSYKFTACE